MKFYIIKSIRNFPFIPLKLYFSTRVRFAPSPTGFLHVGGLKTALVNFLFAKSTGGRLILRIEDTDQSRYDCNSINHIIKSLNWLHIHIDEGLIDSRPDSNYVQSSRLDLYKTAVDKLLNENRAYHCFCSNHRLDFLRKEQIRRGENPGYDRKCLYLTKCDIEKKLLQKSEFTIRLKLEGNSPVQFNDCVFGDVSIPLSNVESDPIIFKSDGYPVYHLANVVDDHEMEITHVIRGQEWLVSTPKHITIYKAFGWKPPMYGHLPLVVKDNGIKISKRDEDFVSSFYSIDRLMTKGFTPDSVRAWLMSCGGGLKDDWYPSITLPELIEKFSLRRITTHNARLSQDVLNSAGREHISKVELSQEYFNNTILPFLEINELKVDYTQFKFIFDTLRHRITCLSDILNFSYIWSHCPVKVNDLLDILGGRTHNSKTQAIQELLKRFIVLLEKNDNPISYLDTIHHSLCEKAVAMKCIRMVLINRLEGPKISELISMLTTKELIRRVKSALSDIEYC